MVDDVLPAPVWAAGYTYGILIVVADRLRPLDRPRKHLYSK